LDKILKAKIFVRRLRYDYQKYNAFSPKGNYSFQKIFKKKSFFNYSTHIS